MDKKKIDRAKSKANLKRLRSKMIYTDTATLPKRQKSSFSWHLFTYVILFAILGYNIYILFK